MWGIRPDHKPEPWFGARTIYEECGPYTFGLVSGRGAVEGKKAEVKKLTEWLDATGFKLLESKLREEGIRPSDDKQVQVEQDGYVLVANPRMSCGYLYIGAWRAQ